MEHFGKVTRSYRPGLFHCYAVADLPRTNNGLEQLFGSQRYHERRATGRKAASPAVVLRGEVRLIAATATRLHPPTARELGRADRQRWRDLRGRLDRGARREPNAPASGAILRPTWPNWSGKPASQLCRPSFFTKQAIK